VFGSMLRASALGFLAAALLTACGKGTPLTSGTATPPPPYVPSVTSEYPIPTGSSRPMGIVTTTVDNSLWFTESASSKLGNLQTNGKISTPEPLTPTKNAFPNQIASGPNGNLWFTETAIGKVGQITLLATPPIVTEFPLDATARPTALTLGSDGNMWVADPPQNKVWKVSQRGIVGPACGVGGQPNAIASGPDGALWFTEGASNRIGRLPLTGTAACGTLTEFPIPTKNAGLSSIVSAQDNALWFLERNSKKLGRMEVTGKVTNEYSLAPAIAPTTLIQGVDTNFYFSDPASNEIGRFVISTKKVTLYKIPTANSLPGTMTLGPDNQIYFVETGSDHIGQFKYFCC